MWGSKENKIKYVIWGCGLIGKQAVGMLGGERRIAAIIEGNKALQGSRYCGVPVISFNEYMLDFPQHPVIVTPLYFEDEIMQQLKQENIFWAFPFSKDRAAIESLLIQLPLSQTLERYHKGERIAIYGTTVLGFVLYDLFQERGFDTYLIIPHNTDPLVKKYATDILRLKTVSTDEAAENHMRLLLAVELETDDQDKLCGIPCDRYYDLHLQKELFYNPELERFRNVHKGGRCFIVATGPSLRMGDLDTLFEHGEICISVNGIFRAFSRTKWRPDYYVVADPSANEWKEDILGMEVHAKFIADSIGCFHDKCYDNVYKWHLIRGNKYGQAPDFSDDFSRGGYFGRTVVYEGGLQLAVYMGFKEIYLLGTDCTLADNGKTPHFVDEEDEDPGRLDIKEMMIAYQVAKRYGDSHGIKIYNATRGGALEIFERVDFDSLF